MRSFPISGSPNRRIIIPKKRQLIKRHRKVGKKKESKKKIYIYISEPRTKRKINMGKERKTKGEKGRRQILSSR